MSDSLGELLAGVGDILLNLRQEAGLTQRQAAKIIGTTQAEVTYIEKAKKADIKLSTLLKIAKAFDQELWVFITPPEEEESDRQRQSDHFDVRTNPEEVQTEDRGGRAGRNQVAEETQST